MSSNQLVDSCLLVNRRVEQRQEHSITHTEITQRRVLQEQGPEMQHYKGTNQTEAAGAGYHAHSNGHTEHSPNSSHHSVHSEDALVSRTHKQQTTQHVTTVTKVIREVQHLGSDGQPVDCVAMPLGLYPQNQYLNYNHLDHQSHTHQPHFDQYHAHSHALAHPHYQEYDTYPSHYVPAPYANTMGPTYTGEYGERTGSPPSPSEHSGSPSPLPLQQAPQPGYLPTGYDEMDPLRQLTDHYRVTPSPGAAVDRYTDDPAVVYGYVSPSPYGMNPPYDARPGLYEESFNGPVMLPGRAFEDEEELQKHMAAMSVRNHPLTHVVASPGSTTDDQRAMRWRDPNLTEVIGFLNNPNNVIKANAAAYLQHLCYMDDPNKQKTRSLGGIPPLVKLLSHESPDVFRNACGALRNLSYGRQNDENKRAIKNAGGIPALITLLQNTNESEVKELVTGVIWNMSSCEDLKRSIIDDGIGVIVTHIIIPHSGWDPNSSGETCWSTVFRNASGVLRNVSSAGEYARTKLRECEGLVDALLYVVRSAIDKSNIGNKIVENCVCILRNLSYRCQEVEDPNYDKHPLPTQNRVAASPKGDNLGCFGASKKKKDSPNIEQKDNSNAGSGTTSRSSIQHVAKGYEILWQPDVVLSYLSLLQSCSNPETLEAAAGALQNLAACYWQPSIDIRAAVRKEKGLPILVELLRMEVDRVVCAVATALRNLAIDQRNKELVGKYAMRDLIQKLPSNNPQHDQGTSDDTIAAVLATLNEVIKKNAEFSRSLLEAGGVERLMNITRQRQKYTARVLKFAGQVLFTMWQHQELRDVYKKHGWKEQDFVTKTVAARNVGPNSPNNGNSTLNRPMASQSGTRYEDRTMKRNPAPARNSVPVASAVPNAQGPGPFYQRADDIPMADMTYAEHSHPSSNAPPPGGVRIFPPGAPPTSLNNPPPANAGSEPLYAQVNRERKKNRQTTNSGSWEPEQQNLENSNGPRSDSWV